MTKINDIESLKKELKEKLQEIKYLEAEVEDLQVEIKNNSFNPIEGFFDSNVINKFKIKYCGADDLIENVPILSDQISILKDSLYNYKKQKYIFYTNKEIKNMKYYYEIIYSENYCIDYYNAVVDLCGDKHDDPVEIIGLAKYTLIKDKNGKNIRVFVYPENDSNINQGFINKDILKLVMTFPEENINEMANFILKYIEKDSEKINFLNKIANEPCNECYSAFIFDKNSYDLDKDFEDSERFKRILKETIVNFTKNKEINLVSFVNKEDVPFNLDFHLMIS